MATRFFMPPERSEGIFLLRAFQTDEFELLRRDAGYFFRGV